MKYAYTQEPGTCNIDLFKNYNFKILRKKLTLNGFAKIMAGFEFHHESLIKDPCECKVCTVYIHVYCQKYFKTAQNSPIKKVSICWIKLISKSYRDNACFEVITLLHMTTAGK